MPTHQIVPMLLRWYSRNARALPWRRTRNPYAIWVSEIMLQQTQVNTVIPFWRKWMRDLPTLQALAKAPPEKIHKLWEGLGYYTRVRNMQRAAQLILANHGGRFPSDYGAVLGLPGIGPYTAGAICSIAFGQPTPVLDGNVTRVLTRLFAIGGNPRAIRNNRRLWRLAAELVDYAAVYRPPAQSRKSTVDVRKGTCGYCSELNQALMELGALVCTARNPGCHRCPLWRLCQARKAGRVHLLPSPYKRPSSVRRHFAAFLLERDGRFLIRQRPSGVVNAQFWEFPNIELKPGSQDVIEAARRELSIPAVRLIPLCSLKHSITRYRITLDAFRVSPPSERQLTHRFERWVSLRQLEKLPFTSAHRKLADRVGAIQRNHLP